MEQQANNNIANNFWHGRFLRVEGNRVRILVNRVVEQPIQDPQVSSTQGAEPLIPPDLPEPAVGGPPMDNNITSTTP